MNVLSNIDLNKNQLLNALLQIIAGNHGTPVEGLIWYDSGGKVIKYYDGTNPVTLASGSGISPNAYDANSILKADTDNTPVALPVAADTLVGRATGVDGGAITDLTVAEVRTMLGLTDELLQDLVGAMVNGGTETGITVTYDDANARFDFVVGALNTLTAPTGDLSLNSQKITNLANGSASTDAATYGQLLSAIEGRKWKDPVRVATTAAITLASGAENGDTIDGVTLFTGDRILIKNQASAAENGIYVVAASGAPIRADDSSTVGELTDATVIVQEGTTNQGDIYTQTATLAAFGDQVWAKTGEGNTTYAADGSTLELTGNTFSIKDAGVTAAKIAAAVAGNGLTGGAGSALAVGAGTGISVAADAVSVDTSVVPRKYSANVGDGSSTTIGVTHNLGTRAVHVTVFRNSTPWDTVLCDVERPDTNTVNLKFAVAPTSAQYTVLVTG